MAKFIRYALASVCFAASVVCLALWGWSNLYYRELQLPTVWSGIEVHGNAFAGMLKVFASEDDSVMTWKYTSHLMSQRPAVGLADPYKGRAFGLRKAGGTYWGFLPLWYAAHIVALAGVGVLRLGRRFTIRSAMVATTIVAGVLGMAVIL